MDGMSLIITGLLALAALFFGTEDTLEGNPMGLVWTLFGISLGVVFILNIAS